MNTPGLVVPANPVEIDCRVAALRRALVATGCEGTAGGQIEQVRDKALDDVQSGLLMET